RHGEGQTLNNLGLVYDSQGRWEEAIAQYEQSLEICRALGDRHGEGLTLYNLGNLYQQRLQYDKAIDYWQNAQTKIHPDAPAAQQLAQKLKNPYGLSTKQLLIGCLPQLALLIFAALNLIRGHWPLAFIIVLAWACFLTYRIWRIRRGPRA
ncbi:MAG: tetratricopeptide repeat protein, partial [Cyanobacteria bacterium J06597_16]